MVKTVNCVSELGWALHTVIWLAFVGLCAGGREVGEVEEEKEGSEIYICAGVL